MHCTSFIPEQSNAVTIKTRTAAHGSTTTLIPGIVTRAKKEGRLSGPPKYKAWNHFKFICKNIR